MNKNIIIKINSDNITDDKIFTNIINGLNDRMVTVDEILLNGCKIFDKINGFNRKESKFVDKLEYDKCLNAEIEFLNSIDIKPLIKTYSNVKDLMRYIEDTYQKKYKSEELIFTCMNIDDFIDYLLKRYDVSVFEDITYKIKLKEEV